jgi:hypothetical protein
MQPQKILKNVGQSDAPTLLEDPRPEPLDNDKPDYRQRCLCQI